MEHDTMGSTDTAYVGSNVPVTAACSYTRKTVTSLLERLKLLPTGDLGVKKLIFRNWLDVKI